MPVTESTWQPHPIRREALRRAGGRLTQIHLTETVTDLEALVAAADWMLWVVDLDDQFSGLVGRKAYEAGRRVSVASLAILGVKYAWNLTKHHGHELESVVEVKKGMQWPVQWPMAFREVTWLPFERLTPIEQRDQDREWFKQREAAYRDLLAGRPVRLLASDITSHLTELAVAHRG